MNPKQLNKLLLPKVVLTLMSSNYFSTDPEIIKINFDYSRLFFQTIAEAELIQLNKELINNYSHLASEDEHLLFAGYAIVKLHKSDLKVIQDFEERCGCIRQVSDIISVFDFSNLKLNLKETS